MKIGIVSDIHCNARSLASALRAMEDVDEIFCAGDAVYGFRWSNEVIDLLRERGARMVMGNHDRDFLQVHRERQGSNGYITPENHSYIAQCPFRYEIEVGGRHILMVHGSPFDASFEYIFPHSEQFKHLGELEADLFIYGHTHFSVVRQVGNVLVVNPGSAGEPRDPERPRFTYAVVDLASMEGSIHDVVVPGDPKGAPGHNGAGRG